MRMNLREVCTVSLRAFSTTGMKCTSFLLGAISISINISISISIDLTAFIEGWLPRFARIYDQIHKLLSYD